MTERITPLDGDCGQLCGKICCRPDPGNTQGMYLFPGEESMFTGREPWLRWERRHPAEDDFPASWSYPVYFISCIKPCPREHRPLSCRFFPLTPHLFPDNQFILIYETLTLSYTCPLIQRRIPLRKDFIAVVTRCWQALLKDRRVRDLVRLDSQEREKEGIHPVIVWHP